MIEGGGGCQQAVLPGPAKCYPFPGATQSSVSKWVTGEIQKPRRPTVDAIRAYVAESERFVGGEADQARAASQDGAAFAAAVRDLADEPLLGPRQGAALDAVTERIRSGQPMSEADERVIHHQWQVLGLLGRTIVESPGLDPTSS